MKSKSQQLQAVYAKVPKLQCKRLCQESCGPIGCTREERRILVKTTGRAPKVRDDLTCSLLVNGACSGYAFRPLICRLYGVVESMACPHGCKPERYLTDREGFELMQEAERVGGEDKLWLREMERIVRLAMEATA